MKAYAMPISFCDKFVALGRFAGGEIGAECAGIVSNAGKGCLSKFERGDRVIMISLSSFRSHSRESV